MIFRNAKHVKEEVFITKYITVAGLVLLKVSFKSKAEKRCI